MPTHARAVIFDIDGTLIDSVDGHARAWQEVFSRHGVDVAFEDVRRQIGKGGDQLMPVFLPDDLLRSRGKQIEQERSALFKSRDLPGVRAFPGVRDLFQSLRASGIRTFLASSAKADDIERYKEIAGVVDLVDGAASSDEAERSKPHPDIFQAALAKVGGAAPGDCVAVGDTPYDAEAATKAGLLAVGVLCGGFPEADLRAAGCLAIYRDPADLLARLDASPVFRGRDR